MIAGPRSESPSRGQSAQSANTGSRRPASSSRVGGTPTVVGEAAWALGEIGEPARGAIEHVLNTGFAPPEILYAAARLRPVPTAALITYFWPGNRTSYAPRCMPSPGRASPPASGRC